MEEEKKRGKEYYQLNLDTGRIFWIAFVLGLILIGIFFFGFYSGSGKIKDALLGISIKQPPLKEKMEPDTVAMEGKKEIPHVVDVISKDLQEEVKYIDIEGFEKAVEKEEPLSKKPSHHVPVIEDKYEKIVTPSRPAPEKPRTYVSRGNYYIQVASFTSEENANNFAEMLRKKMYKVTIEKAVIEEKTYYRVRVGPFEQKSVATNTMVAMKRIFNLSNPFVVKKNS